MRALTEAFFTDDQPLAPERMDAYVDDVDDHMSRASKTLRFGLVLMLGVLRWSPLLFGKFRLFEDMTVEDRIHHLERLDRSKVTALPLIVVAYKTVMTMLFYEDEKELAALGYPGPARKRYLTVAP